MLPGIFSRSHVFLRRIFADTIITRSYAVADAGAAGESEALPIATSAPSLRKRVKKRKEDWQMDPKTLFIANFPKSTTEAELLHFFSQVGFATEIRKFPNAIFCWCLFENKRHADRARRELHHTMFRGRRIVVYEGQRTRIKPIPEVVCTC